MTPQQAQNQLKRDNKRFGKTPKLIYQKADAKPGEPLQAWRSKNFLVQITKEESGFTRMTVQRCAINHDGTWEDGITWDELQELKAQVGLGETWAVEVYPPESQLVNVSNLRHLWLVTDAPFAWKDGRNTEKTPGVVAEWSEMLGV